MNNARTSSLVASAQFDFNVASTIIRSEKPNKGLEAKAAANPNLLHRITGYLENGTKITVAHRPGNGGMDFTKLLGGKVFAVAADGFSPVYEKGADKKPSKVQKTEDGLPLYSASGFYLLSSKEYPALSLHTAYALLQDKGARVLLLTDAQLAAKQETLLESELDLDLFEVALADALADSKSSVAGFDAETNKKRQRGITRAQEEAGDSGDAYAGVEFQELHASQKSGWPFVLLVWAAEQAKGHALIVREVDLVDQDSGHLRTVHMSAEQAVAHFKDSKEGKALMALVDAGQVVSTSFVQGNALRTSVSFRRKAENVLATDDTKAQFGDAVFVRGALKGWCKAIVSILHSQHPKFPAADYDAHHYVAALRQAEVGMNRKEGGTGWQPPVAMHYGVGTWLLKSLPKAAAPACLA